MKQNYCSSWQNIGCVSFCIKTDMSLKSNVGFITSISTVSLPSSFHLSIALTFPLSDAAPRVTNLYLR